VCGRGGGSGGFFNFLLEHYLVALPAQADVICSDQLFCSILSHSAFVKELQCPNKA
jgi:hypothetical protein